MNENVFIRRLEIKNFRLFSSDESFIMDDINMPDGENEGSGLTVLVGENGCGKTSILDALAMPFVSYKADSFSIDDMNELGEKKCEISIYTDKEFNYKGTMPKAIYQGIGFEFNGGLRSRGSNHYLSSMVVTDQKVIKENESDAPQGYSPDLRLSVNNPWSGSRFDMLEYLILDKNRTYQTRKGTYNDTRFDRIMEDMNFQYMKMKDNTPIDCNFLLNQLGNYREISATEKINNAIDKFARISEENLAIELMDNCKPFENAFFGVRKDNHQTIKLSQLGSGYEMIFSLIYSYYLSKKENKSLIILIDEPELHMHPKLQMEFINLLFEFSKDSQIIITTHSPLLVKQAMSNQHVSVKILKKGEEKVFISPLGDRALPWLSANEMNFIAFDLPIEEYHNELYGLIVQNNKLNDYKIGKTERPYVRLMADGSTRSPIPIILSTYIRHQIHHPENTYNVKYTREELKESIESMREFIIKENLS